jgi:alpha/beta hydrolase fold
VGPLSRYFDLIVPDLIFFGGSTTKSPTRSELFQAQSLVKLLDALGVGERNDNYVVGTSYGGFVGYHVARLLGEKRIKKVVIASSDLLKAEADDKALLERAGVKHISDLLLPKEPDNVKVLLEMAFHHPPKFLPNFVLWDVVQVKKVILRLFISLICPSITLLHIINSSGAGASSNSLPLLKAKAGLVCYLFHKSIFYQNGFKQTSWVLNTMFCCRNLYNFTK